jgi:hypothetical protein
MSLQMMSDFDQLQIVIDAERFNERHPDYEQYVFQRGWNSALLFVSQAIARIEADRVLTQPLASPLMREQAER